MYKGYELMVDLLLEHGARASAKSPSYDALTASTDRFHLMIALLLGVLDFSNRDVLSNVCQVVW